MTLQIIATKMFTYGVEYVYIGTQETLRKSEWLMSDETSVSSNRIWFAEGLEKDRGWLMEARCHDRKRRCRNGRSLSWFLPVPGNHGHKQSRHLGLEICFLGLISY